MPDVRCAPARLACAPERLLQECHGSKVSYRASCAGTRAASSCAKENHGCRHKTMSRGWLPTLQWESDRSDRGESGRPAGQSPDPDLPGVRQGGQAPGPGGAAGAAQTRSQQGLHDQDQRCAGQGTGHGGGDDRRVLRLPMTVLFEGRSDPQASPRRLRRQRPHRLEAPASGHA